MMPSRLLHRPFGSVASALFASVAVAALLSLTACGWPYRMEVAQGNVVTPEMVAELKPGMTKRQVRFLLGSPAITDAFHPQRWEYVFARHPLGKDGNAEHLTLYFDGDTLARFEGSLGNTP